MERCHPGSGRPALVPEFHKLFPPRQLDRSDLSGGGWPGRLHLPRGCLAQDGRPGRVLTAAAHLPALLGGGLFVLSTLLMFVPPFTLGGLFAFDELAGEKQIQQIESPDRRLTADVYFRGVGAYSGGNGRVDMRIRDRFVPFLERDVYYLGRSLASETSSEYVSWLDNRTLKISETGETVDVRGVKTGVPAIVVIPAVLIRMLIEAGQEGQ